MNTGRSYIWNYFDEVQTGTSSSTDADEKESDSDDLQTLQPSLYKNAWTTDYVVRQVGGSCQFAAAAVQLSQLFGEWYGVSLSKIDGSKAIRN